MSFEEAAVPKPFPFEQLLHSCTIGVRIRSHELAKQLAAMRLCCRNQVFHCRPSGADAVIRVESDSDGLRFSDATSADLHRESCDGRWVESPESDSTKLARVF